MRQSTTKRTLSPIEQVRRRSRIGVGGEVQETTLRASGKAVKRRLSAEDEQMIVQAIYGPFDASK
jgi:hypothetical protein